jgi:catechol 2,3-dioxygenase-like lactoylglutathione lyase family enzyme
LQSGKDNFTLELNFYEKDSPNNTKCVVGEGLDHLVFKIDNLDKASKEAQSAGYRTVLKMKADGGQWAYIADPDGIWIELF